MCRLERKIWSASIFGKNISSSEIQGIGFRFLKLSATLSFS